MTRKARNKAITLKPARRKIYIDVLFAARQNVKPEDFGAPIKSIRKTRIDDVLVEITKVDAEKRAELEKALKTATQAR